MQKLKLFWVAAVLLLLDDCVAAPVGVIDLALQCDTQTKHVDMLILRDKQPGWPSGHICIDKSRSMNRIFVNNIKRKPVGNTGIFNMLLVLDPERSKSIYSFTNENLNKLLVLVIKNEAYNRLQILDPVQDGHLFITIPSSEETLDLAKNIANSISDDKTR